MVIRVAGWTKDKVSILVMDALYVLDAEDTDRSEEWVIIFFSPSCILEQDNGE
jgi:hypothetical protein